MTKFCNSILLLLGLGIIPLFGQKADNVDIRYSETYELANVILALTPYGISDKWEVQKETPYYNEVMTFFEPVKTHPLLEKANYSRELWADYLSFRTDAFAFAVQPDGKITRKFEFYANEGRKPFDDNLALVQDFYEKSNFHQFFEAHKTWYESIRKGYANYFMVDEMQAFLQQEFGTFKNNDKNLIVFSPLVNRMNCRRSLSDTVSADFATLALSLMNGTADKDVPRAQRASDLHFLFTEMDHGYVNPTTDHYRKQVSKSFHYKKWDEGSGYTGSDCFNEYMTWAVYDLFTLRYFPDCAGQVNRDWHFQNNTRGFFASSAFAAELVHLYSQKKASQTVRDLYPALLRWTKQNEPFLKIPSLAVDTLVFNLQDMRQNRLTIPFSIEMMPMPLLDAVLFKVESGERKKIDDVSFEKDKNLWFEGNNVIIQGVPFPDKPGIYGLTFNIIGRKSELRSKNGAPLPTPTRIFIEVK